MVDVSPGTSTQTSTIECGIVGAWRQSSRAGMAYSQCMRDQRMDRLHLADCPPLEWFVFRSVCKSANC
jgi:hypothetical protein